VKLSKRIRRTWFIAVPVVVGNKDPVRREGRGAVAVGAHKRHSFSVLAANAKIPSGMSPTVFRDGKYRFYFNSREEDRMHVHIESPEGELKVWLEPRIEVAQNHGLPGREISTILRVLEERHGEIEKRWRQHHRN
jgi:Domain of unknown function (DUF4160)